MTRTPSNPYNQYEVENRPRDYDRWQAEQERERIARLRAMRETDPSFYDDE